MLLSQLNEEFKNFNIKIYITINLYQPNIQFYKHNTEFVSLYKLQMEYEA